MDSKLLQITLKKTNSMITELLSVLDVVILTDKLDINYTDLEEVIRSLVYYRKLSNKLEYLLELQRKNIYTKTINMHLLEFSTKKQIQKFCQYLKNIQNHNNILYQEKLTELRSHFVDISKERVLYKMIQIQYQELFELLESSKPFV